VCVCVCVCVQIDLHDSLRHGHRALDTINSWIDSPAKLGRYYVGRCKHVNLRPVLSTLTDLQQVDPVREHVQSILEQYLAISLQRFEAGDWHNFQ